MESPEFILNLNPTLMPLPFDSATRNTISKRLTYTTPNETTTCKPMSAMAGLSGIVLHNTLTKKLSTLH
jgi:hypothetical protein